MLLYQHNDRTIGAVLEKLTEVLEKLTEVETRVHELERPKSQLGSAPFDPSKAGQMQPSINEGPQLVGPLGQWRAHVRNALTYIDFIKNNTATTANAGNDVNHAFECLTQHLYQLLNDE